MYESASVQTQKQREETESKHEEEEAEVVGVPDIQDGVTRLTWRH